LHVTPRPLRHPDEILRVLERLDEVVWTANAVAAAAESGLIRHLREPSTAEEIAGHIGMPPALAQGLLDVLVSLGFVERDGARVRAAPALAPFAGADGEQAFRAALRGPLLQGDDLRRRASDRALDLDGWRFTDAAVIEAQGALTALWVERAVPKLRLLPGLVPQLERPGAVLLDVGAGAAGLSIVLCRNFPYLHAVALEPAAHPAAIGERHVQDAGLADRIAFRRQRVEHLADEAAFDLAFLPQMFLPDAVIETATQAVFRALRPGGWLLAAVLARRGDDIAAAVSRLKNLLWGGNVRDGDALRPILLGAGFAPVIRAPGRAAIRIICARRPPA
jgi:precorrin-6B methylase 2